MNLEGFKVMFSYHYVETREYYSGSTGCEAYVAEAV